MATLHDFDSFDEPPPPAYEFSQQEFDQKISQALEQSRATADEGGEWEVWDEAAFAAAAARLTVSESDSHAGASSSRSPPPTPALASSSSASRNGDGRSYFSNEEGTTTQPLRIVKKSREPSAKEKERPSWYADAGLDTHRRSTSTSRGPVPQRVPTSRNVASSTPNHIAASESVADEREPTPPPMFEPVGPSLEGPPYEGYEQLQPGLVMAYAPGDSRPPSPLHSPTTSPQPVQTYTPAAQPLIHPVPERRSLPIPPTRPPVPSSVPEPQEQQPMPVPQPPRPSAHRPNLRPTVSYRDRLKTKSYVPPRVAFDPRIAYGDKDRSPYYDVPEESPPLDIDPAAFYTASVSSIYSSDTQRARTTSIVSSSMYSQHTAGQSTYSLPQSQYGAQPQAHYPSRENMRSPAPSVHSVASQSSQNQSHNYNGYQTAHAAPAPSRVSAYSPTMYQPTTYQSTSYQQHPHQQPQSLTFQQSQNQQQQPISHSFQTNGYSPTAY